MQIFSYHLVKLSSLAALKALLFPLKNIEGLIHAEALTAMKLGSAVCAPTRFFNTTIILFAQWDNEQALDTFLQSHSFGKNLAKGWHIRLAFLRQWGFISGYRIPEMPVDVLGDNEPIVAVTIARMKFFEIPRFIKWGRPVEKQVRDHDATTLSLACIRHPNTISTFSIWKTQKAMTDMVFGHDKTPDAKQHILAMKERNRREFHHEFSTFRFKPISEHGVWNNKTNFIP